MKTTKKTKNTAMMDECIGVKYDARTGKYSSVRGTKMVPKNEYYRVYMSLKRKHAKTLVGKTSKTSKKTNKAKARKTIDRMIATLQEIKTLILASSETVKVDLLALTESLADTAKSIDAGNRKYYAKKAKKVMV